MSFRFIGYFPKKIEPATAAMAMPGVKEIWSVSECISSGPENWIDHWKHNEWGVYDTLELARSVCDTNSVESFCFLAFSLWSEQFGKAVPRHPLSEPSPSPPVLASDFELVGYDAVSCSGGANFECSPLSSTAGLVKWGRIGPVSPRIFKRRCGWHRWLNRAPVNPATTT